MIPKILLSLFAFTFFQNIMSQEAEIKVSTDSFVTEINALPLKKGESMFIEIADFAAGIATPYTFKKEIIKVERILQLPYGIWQTNYYYNKGKLVMLEDMEETCLINENGELDFSEKEKNYYARFYFFNEKLVESSEIGEKRNNQEMQFNEQIELIQAKLYASEL